MSRRITVATLIIGAALIGGAGYIAFHNTPAKQPTASQSSQKAVQPKAAKPAPPTAHTDAQLQQLVDNWASQQPFDSSVVVQELNGQLRTASRDADTPMTTASTYKIYVAYAVLHQVEQGTYAMQTTTRTGQTVQAALQKMILQSDNDSAEGLGFLVGWDKINQLAAAAGAVHTNINNYDSTGQPTNGNKLSTAADLATMVTKLQQGTLLNVADSAMLLGLMKSQVWRERIPAGVPSGIAVADKPGWLGNVENDAGIVFGPKSTYTLVIMTNDSTTRPLADLSKLVYSYLES
ncbi:MAG TPA: serine hydrolase [Candidatus Saccharimonadales bacterium]|nr:serine hydrolase [Candidatus Saccharimonadales bacterium]